MAARAATLVGGELERQRLAPGSDERAARRERPGAAPLAARAAPAGDGELEQEQLLEGEPAARAALVLLAVREVGGARARRRGRAVARPTRSLPGSGSTTASMRG